jgi:hypothetical protein
MVNNKFVADPSHWAFKEGAKAGEEKDTTQRGVMAFGLGCAKEDIDAQNTKQWLAGFDSTANAPAGVNVARVDPWVSNGTRRPSRVAPKSDAHDELSSEDHALAARFSDSCYGGNVEPPDRKGMLRLAELGIVEEVERGKFAETPKLRELGF